MRIIVTINLGTERTKRIVRDLSKNLRKKLNDYDQSGSGTNQITFRTNEESVAYTEIDKLIKKEKLSKGQITVSSSEEQA